MCAIHDVVSLAVWGSHMNLMWRSLLLLLRRPQHDNSMQQHQWQSYYNVWHKASLYQRWWWIFKHARTVQEVELINIWIPTPQNSLGTLPRVWWARIKHRWFHPNNHMKNHFQHAGNNPHFIAPDLWLRLTTITSYAVKGKCLLRYLSVLVALACVEVKTSTWET